ncbi:MAG: hypothetical protein V1702_06115 [Candidatus Woesearchaeota archaeon]
MNHKTVAFDGLSVAGKSSMVQMLLERSFDAEVVRENTCDKHRPTISRVNELLKEMMPFQAAKKASEEFPASTTVLQNAMEYASQFQGSLQQQALLAHLYTAGRKVVDDYVAEAVQRRDVILDRWQMTGWAYQVDPEGYTWQEIRKLNAEFGIRMPDIQILLTCPIDQISVRRAYREKLGVGTAGQMSRGREHIILPAFLEIYRQLKGKMPIYLLENHGTPVPQLEEQIRQAMPTFQRVEEIVRTHGFRLNGNQITSLEAFLLNSERLQRIYERQTK